MNRKYPTLHITVHQDPSDSVWFLRLNHEDGSFCALCSCAGEDEAIMLCAVLDGALKLDMEWVERETKGIDGEPFSFKTSHDRGHLAGTRDANNRVNGRAMREYWLGVCP